MNIMALIELLDDELSQASSLPLTAKKLVDVDKCLDIISDLRINLPDDIKDAERIVADKNGIIGDAEREAERIVAEAERRYDEMLSEHEITRKATEQAEAIIAQANAEAQDIRLGAIGYADEVLDQLESLNHQNITQISRHRDALHELSR